jgi:hypothetical protein
MNMVDYMMDQITHVKLVMAEAGHLRAFGRVVKSSRFPVGHRIVTSWIEAIVKDVIVTEHSEYLVVGPVTPGVELMSGDYIEKAYFQEPAHEGRA